MFGVIAIVAGVVTTHFLHGALLTPGYRAFMPFSGGPPFVVLQAFGWLMFSTFVLGIIAAWPNVHGAYGKCDGAGAAGGLAAFGSFGLASQIILVASLSTFRPEQAAPALLPISHVNTEYALAWVYIAAALLFFTIIDMAAAGQSPLRNPQRLTPSSCAHIPMHALAPTHTLPRTPSFPVSSSTLLVYSLGLLS